MILAYKYVNHKVYRIYAYNFPNEKGGFYINLLA